MSHWQDHITQLKELLLTIKQDLMPYWDKVNLKEKQLQLQSIEKTITQLQKSNTPVPDELRELKFKLLKKLDAFSEAEAVRTEIVKLLTPYLLKGKPTKHPNTKEDKKKPARSQKSESRIKLVMLIDAGVLPVPLALTKKYKGKIFRSHITEEGQIELELNGKVEIFYSPSAAADAVSNKSQNGWTWWNIEGQPKDRTLDFYRQKMKDHEAKGRR